VRLLQRNTRQVSLTEAGAIFYESCRNILQTHQATLKQLKNVNNQENLKSIENQLKNGDCFELIDGENLEFKGLFIKEVIENSKKDKVVVVCVIGP
jgi:transcription antitermination factor NusG